MTQRAYCARSSSRWPYFFRWGKIGLGLRFYRHQSRKHRHRPLQKRKRKLLRLSRITFSSLCWTSVCGCAIVTPACRLMLCELRKCHGLSRLSCSCIRGSCSRTLCPIISLLVALLRALENLLVLLDLLDRLLVSLTETVGPTVCGDPDRRVLAICCAMCAAPRPLVRPCSSVSLYLCSSATTANVI